MAGAAVLALAGLVLLASAPGRGGPPLSSCSTGPSGVAAWAELLARDGHRVERLQVGLGRAKLPPYATLVVLGRPVGFGAPGVRALARFLRAGGWVILGGAAVSLGPGLPGHVALLPDPSLVENRWLRRGTNAVRALLAAGPAARPVVFDEAIHGVVCVTGASGGPG